jgi:hypothetical protein
MTTRAESLERRIQKIRQELASLGDMRPGSLCRLYNVCGSPGCRCKADPPRKHGPYYQLTWTLHGKHRTEFVRKEDVAEVRRQLRAYARHRSLVERWVDLSLELCRERLKERRQ